MGDQSSASQPQTGNGEPTVLVRRSDGSMARVPLSQVRPTAIAREDSATDDFFASAENTASDEAATPEDMISPAKFIAERKTPAPSAYYQNKASQKTTEAMIPEPPHALATSAPVSNIFVDEAAYAFGNSAQKKERMPKDKKPSLKKFSGIPIFEETKEKRPPNAVRDIPLSEEPPKEEIKGAKTALPDRRDELVSRVLNQLSFSLAQEFYDRLASLIRSRVKDVRTKDQVLVSAKKSPDAGGLGLSEKDARDLAESIERFVPAKNKKPMSPRKKIELQLPRIPVLPEKEYTTPARNAPVPQPAQSVSSSRPRQTPPHQKPIVHDVTRPATMESDAVGPIDEFRLFALKDFRLLASDPKVAADMMLAKFDVLKQDSYLLFMNAVDAWYQSPLYREYQQALFSSIKNDETLADSLAFQGGKAGLSEAEVLALVKVNREIGL